MKIYNFLLFFFVFFPVVLLAWVPGDPIVPCTGVDCNFCALVTLGANLIMFMAYISIPLAVFAFVWAGFKYLTSGGDQGKISQAHNIFKKVVIGLVLTLGAALIVHVIIVALTTYPNVGGIIGCGF